MNTIAPAAGFQLTTNADTALRLSARFWFVVAVVGQLMFVAYLLAFYGAAGVQGDFEAWNKVMAGNYRLSDTPGTTAIAAHVGLAVIIMLGGMSQLVPQIRSRAPALHRITGRVYLLAAVATSLAGLYLVWIRGGTTGDLSQHLGITLNAILIFVCAAMAYRHARARQITEHRRWALRLFMVVCGVWFYRVGLMLWMVVNQGPVGFDPNTFVGPFLTFISFANYLIPLAILELYLRTQERAGPTGRLAMAAGLFALTIAMLVGVGAASMMMWLPRM